jgi:hypothetical protein
MDDPDHRGATLRALLWLEENALQVMRDAGERAFERGDLSFIRRFSQSGAVRHLAAEWLTQREGEGSGR